MCHILVHLWITLLASSGKTTTSHICSGGLGILELALMGLGHSIAVGLPRASYVAGVTERSAAFPDPYPRDTHGTP